MGWCSATEIFDGVIDAIATVVEPDRLSGIAEHVAELLWQGDWDCEQDSKYFKELLLPIMIKKGYVDEDEDDWDEY